MKKRAIFLVLLAIILFLPLTLAIEITLKQEYKPGETLIATIEGNFLSQIKPENILFYSGRAYIPMIYDLAKIQDKYYLYAILPEKERNYTLIIKNARYYEAGQEKTQDLQFDFLVKGNSSLFSVNPGFIITNKEFKIKIEARKTINLKTKFLNSSEETTIPIGTKTLSFSVSPVQGFLFTTLTLEAFDNKYEVPVAIFKEEDIEVLESLRFSKSYFNFTVLENKEFYFPLTLINTGQEDIKNISFSSNLKILKLPEPIPLLEAGKSKEILFIVNSSEIGIKEDFLYANYGKNKYSAFLSILTTKNQSEFQEFIEETEITQGETCTELNGKVCKEKEECDGLTKITADGKFCCVGNCKKESSFGLGKTISLIIIILVLALIGFFIFRKLKAKRKSAEEMIEEKEKEYESRFKPKELKGSLTKV